MQVKILGYATLLVWLLLLTPSIVGFAKGYSFEYIRQNYLEVVFGYNSPSIESLFLFMVFTLTFILYIKMLKACEYTGFTKVMLWAVVFTMILTFLPPFTCEDVYYYIATGQMQSQYSSNPYLENAHQISGWRSDPFLSSSGWGYLLSMYGPLWTILTKWVVLLAGDNLWLAVWLFKLLAGFLHLFNMLIIGSMANYLHMNISRAMVIYGWNPLLLFELPGHAHNDALLISLIILAIAALVHGKELLTLPLLTLSILVKYIPILLVPVFGIWLIKLRKYGILLLGLIVSFLCIPLVWLSYWQGLETLNGILRQFDFYSIKSLHYLLYYSAQQWLPQFPKNLLFESIAKGLSVFFLIILLFIFIKFYCNKAPVMQKLFLTCLVIFISFLLIANKWYQPWYVSWLIPFAAMLNLSSPMTFTVLLLSYSAELSRIPQILLGNTGFLMQTVTFFIAWAPLVWLFFGRSEMIFIKDKD